VVTGSDHRRRELLEMLNSFGDLDADAAVKA
jgi:hypothetical protein